MILKRVNRYIVSTNELHGLEFNFKEVDTENPVAMLKINDQHMIIITTKNIWLNNKIYSYTGLKNEFVLSLSSKSLSFEEGALVCDVTKDLKYYDLYVADKVSYIWKKSNFNKSKQQ